MYINSCFGHWKCSCGLLQYHQRELGVALTQMVKKARQAQCDWFAKGNLGERVAFELKSSKGMCRRFLRLSLFKDFLPFFFLYFPSFLPSFSPLSLSFFLPSSLSFCLSCSLSFSRQIRSSESGKSALMLIDSKASLTCQAEGPLLLVFWTIPER